MKYFLVILLLPLIQVTRESMCLSISWPRKIVVRLTVRINMTIAVDWVGLDLYKTGVCYLVSQLIYLESKLHLLSF